MQIIVHLKEQSQPITHENVLNAYTKGQLYCVMFDDGKTVCKYPLQAIFRIIEVFEP